MSDHLLVADNLTVSRGGRQVLDSVSFSVDKGGVFALLGGNGAGKSTTLLTLLGLVTPTSGEARIDGKRVQENLAEIRHMTAYLPESANLYPHLTARENLDYFLALAGVARTSSDIEARARQSGTCGGSARASSCRVFKRYAAEGCHCVGNSARTHRCCCWTSPHPASIRLQSMSSTR